MRFGMGCKSPPDDRAYIASLIIYASLHHVLLEVLPKESVTAQPPACPSLRPGDTARTSLRRWESNVTYTEEKWRQ